jgi:hypothetical protein
MMNLSIRVLIFMLALTGDVCRATKPERVVIDSTEDFLEGKGASVSIDEPGVLTPGPSISRLADLKDLNIWSAIREAKSGDFILGTGPEGEVFRVRSNGKVMRLSAFIESDVYAVTEGPQGELYVASSPHGKVFRIDGSGKVDEYFNPNEEFIWSMLTNKKGELFVATGSAGKIYRVTGKNSGSVYYDSDESTIKVLAWDKEGRLLAGSADNGYVYRIMASGSAVVLLDSEKEEISALAVQADGSLFVAAIGKRTMPVKTAETPKVEPTKTGSPQPSTSFASDSVAVRESGLAKSPAAGRPTIKGEGSLLYRLSGNFYPEQIWRASQPILSLLAEEGKLWIGTAGEGFIYQYGQDHHIRRLGKVQAGDVTSLLTSGQSGRVYALTSNLGQLFELNSNRTGESVYDSKIIDSSLFSEWGRLQVYGQGKWSVRTRSGNTSDPDKSWYPWSSLQDDKVQSPAARYLQVELSLRSGKVERLECTYLPQNQPPSISSIKVLEPGLGYELLSQPPPPLQAQSVDQLLRPGPLVPVNPDRLQPLQKKGLRTAVWQATDANKDQLLYKLQIRQEGAGNWDLLSEKLDRPVYSWDTNGWEDGVYYLKVTATDSLDNPIKKSLTDERVSEAWKIDNTPPMLSVSRKSAGQVEIDVQDVTSSLKKMEVSVDGQNFTNLQPMDGILDSSQEAFEIPWDQKKPLILRAEDESGNIGGLRLQP